MPPSKLLDSLRAAALPRRGGASGETVAAVREWGFPMLNLLIREVDERFALGDASHALLMELLMLIFDGRAGGVPGLMRKLHQMGLGYLVESWVVDITPVPLQPRQLERIFDSGKLSAMANRLGLVRTTAIAAACASLPELVRLLTRGGRRPIYLPGDVSAYLAKRYRAEAARTRGQAGPAFARDPCLRRPQAPLRFRLGQMGHGRRLPDRARRKHAASSIGSTRDGPLRPHKTARGGSVAAQAIP